MRSCSVCAARRRSILVPALAASLLVAATARGQHGLFDKSAVNPADEAYIFTPPGFEHEGKVAVAEGPTAGRIEVTIVEAATGKPTPCRVNVVGPDGNFYQPKENPLAAFSLNGKWPDTLAGNRPSKAPIRYFGHFFYTTGTFAVDVPEGAVRSRSVQGLRIPPEGRKRPGSGRPDAGREDRAGADRADGQTRLVFRRSPLALHSRQRQGRRDDFRSARSRRRANGAGAGLQ